MVRVVAAGDVLELATVYGFGHDLCGEGVAVLSAERKARIAAKQKEAETELKRREGRRQYHRDYMKAKRRKERRQRR